MASKLDEILKPEKPTDSWSDVLSSSTLEIMVQYAAKQGKKPVLVVDQANALLDLGYGANARPSTLSALVSLTKQQGLMHVIMASTDYMYPYKLERNGLNLADISGMLFAGEILPKSMWHLLTTKMTGGSGGSATDGGG